MLVGTVLGGVFVGMLICFVRVVMCMMVVVRVAVLVRVFVRMRHPIMRVGMGMRVGVNMFMRVIMFEFVFHSASPCVDLPNYGCRLWTGGRRKSLPSLEPGFEPGVDNTDLAAEQP